MRTTTRVYAKSASKNDEGKEGKMAGVHEGIYYYNTGK